jgi:putative ABC transport system permease protein
MAGSPVAPSLARPAGDDVPPWAFRQPLPLRVALRRGRSLAGVTVGVGAALGIVLLLIALAEGVFGMLVEDYTASGVDLYATERGGVLVPVLPGDDMGELRPARELITRVRAMPGVHAALGVVIGQLERTPAGPRGDAPAEVVAAVGVDGGAETIPGAVLMHQGRWLRRDDEVVLGSRLARDLGVGPGDTVVLERRRLTVVGVGRLRGVGLGAMSPGLAFLDYRALRGMTGMGDAVAMLMVDANDPAAVRARVEAEFARVAVSDRAAMIAAMATMAEHDVVFMRAGSALSLGIAGVFVSSLLLRAVAERRSELATLRAIGVPKRTLVGMVVVEALAVTTLAAPLGLAIGHLAGGLVNRVYANWLDMDAIYRFDAALAAAIGLLALLLGLLASVLPARRALAVEPADVLREA